MKTTWSDELGQLQQRAWAGAWDEVAKQLEAWAHARMEDEGGHFETALLASELGLSALMMRELHLALRDQPEDVRSLQELAMLHQERGESEQCAYWRSRLATAVGEQELALQEEPPVTLEPVEDERVEVLEQAPQHDLAWLEPSRGDLLRFLHLFSGRPDVHARQWYEPSRGAGYSPVHQPLSPNLLMAHLDGELTLGVYPLRLDGTVRFFALDLDVTKQAIAQQGQSMEGARGLRRTLYEEAKRLKALLDGVGLTGLMEDSGWRGRHVWFFLREPVSVKLVHELGQQLLRCFWPEDEALSLEFFPKQEELKGKGLGNLIKLPLGVHKRTGRRGVLLDDQQRELEDPWGALHGAKLHDALELEHALRLLKGRQTPEGSAHRPAGVGEQARGKEEDERAFKIEELERDPQLRALLSGCPLIARLVSDALATRVMSYQARVILRHSLGHLERGPAAWNFLLERCEGGASWQRLGRRLSGAPSSCAKLQERIEGQLSPLPCACDFSARPDHYASPLLHVDGVLEQRPALIEEPRGQAAIELWMRELEQEEGLT